jgi:hypothetical protein
VDCLRGLSAQVDSRSGSARSPWCALSQSAALHRGDQQGGSAGRVRQHAQTAARLPPMSLYALSPDIQRPVWSGSMARARAPHRPSSPEERQAVAQVRISWDMFRLRRGARRILNNGLLVGQRYIGCVECRENKKKRCFWCQRLGHLAWSCKEAPLCGHCANTSSKYAHSVRARCLDCSG